MNNIVNALVSYTLSALSGVCFYAGLHVLLGRKER